ncbi:hypothetical protein TNIN_24551 [Trichonephila inaurata madagascariensis]|uniref:Uncharacterized protein n=1 Tax=Trichonephila inaurata madagascariensis TaxID=2747483 RepID=A0A8X7BQ81_9ARAC|nr:hypothetical protein TNIN_24551 [Trichonephila inaurata madagascariensis]
MKTDVLGDEGPKPQPGHFVFILRFPKDSFPQHFSGELTDWLRFHKKVKGTPGRDRRGMAFPGKNPKKSWARDKILESFRRP